MDTWPEIKSMLQNLTLTVLLPWNEGWQIPCIVDKSVFFFSIFFYCLYSIHFKFLMELDNFWNYLTHCSKFYKNLDCSWLRKRTKSNLLTDKEELFFHINTKSINMETFRLKVGWSSYLIIAGKIHFLFPCFSSTNYILASC